MTLDVEFDHNMPRKKSKAVSKGNAPVPYDTYVMSGGITLEEIRRIMSEALDEAFDEATEVMRKARQRLAGLEQDARRSRLSMEADVSADRKTRKRTEGAASADRAKHIGDSSSAQVDPDPMCLTSFGDDSIETLALHPREDALVIDKERYVCEIRDRFSDNR